MAELIKVPFEDLTWVVPGNRVRWGWDHHGRRAILWVLCPIEKHCEFLLRCV